MRERWVREGLVRKYKEVLYTGDEGEGKGGRKGTEF